jgi:phosphatidylcholine synthase
MKTDVKHESARVAWAIHVFTATGALCGLLGLLAVIDGNPRAALLWIMAAQVIDGLDGPAARRLNVREMCPKIDGNVLDLVIDYLTCVVAPAIFIVEFELVPGNIALLAAGTILVSSLYVFARTDLSAPGGWFRGFPAMWCFVVTCMVVLDSHPTANVAIVAVFVALQFAPIKFVHPLRVRELRQITAPVTALWIGAMSWQVWLERTYVVQLQGVIWFGIFWLLFVSFRRTWLDSPKTKPRPNWTFRH